MARVYSREFRLEVVQRVLLGEKVPVLAAELGIHRKLLYQWVRQVKEGGEKSLRLRGRPRREQEIAGGGSVREMQQTINRQQMMINFLRLALEQMGSVESRKQDWRNAVFHAMQQTARSPGLTVDAMCQLVGLARCGYYRFLRAQSNGQASIESQRASSQAQ